MYGYRGMAYYSPRAAMGYGDGGYRGGYGDGGYRGGYGEGGYGDGYGDGGYDYGGGYDGVPPTSPAAAVWPWWASWARALAALVAGLVLNPAAARA
jgi:hypothetical protein